MRVPCESCGAGLRLNPKLQGTTVSCPQCGAAMTVPEPPPQPEPAPAPRASRRRPEEARPKRPTRFTVWLLLAQVSLGLLGVSCLAAALFTGWEPHPRTYFAEAPVLLIVVGMGLVVAGWIAHYLPVLTTLGVTIFVLCVCGHSFVLEDEVDASRTLALSIAMLALWLCLQHRRVVVSA